MLEYEEKLLKWPLPQDLRNARLFMGLADL